MARARHTRYGAMMENGGVPHESIPSAGEIQRDSAQ